jgi:O-antigen ligase
MKNDLVKKITVSNFFSIAGLPGLLLIAYPVMLALVSRQREFDEVASIDSSAVIQIVFASIAFASAFYIFLKNKLHRDILFKTPLKWFVIYVLWAAISSFWSVQLSLTAYRAFENIAYLLLITAVMSRLYRKIGIKGMIDWVMKYAVFTIIVNIFRRIIQFDMSLFSLGTLIAEQMNSTPYFFLALLLPVGWLIKAVILPISIFSTSNTAYAGMASGLLAFGKGNVWLRSFFVVIVTTTAVLIYTIGPESILQQTIFYGKEGVGLEYTTGRVNMFERTYEEAMKKPFFGYGFVAGDTFVINKAFNAAIGVHNGVLSAFLGTGLIGTLLFVIFLFRMFWVSKSNVIPDTLRGAFFSTTILIIVHTMGNPGLGTRVYGTWIPAVLIFSMISLFYLHYTNRSSDENNLGYT